MDLFIRTVESSRAANISDGKFLKGDPDVNFFRDVTLCLTD